MSGRDNIVQFKRDDALLVKLGRQCYDDGEYAKAIKYFLSLPYLDEKYLDCGMMLADSYARLEFIDNAMYIYWQLYEVCEGESRALVCLKISEIAQIIDEDLAKYYLNMAQKADEDSVFAIEAESRLNMLIDMDRRRSAGLKDVRQVASDLQFKLMMEGRYDAVLELAEKNNLEDPQSREAVELSYLSSDREQECLQFIRSIKTEKSIVELCIYYMCLSHSGQTDALASVRGEILSQDISEGHKLPLCINVLCMSGDVDLALYLAKKCVRDFNADHRLRVVYAKLLMANSQFDEAREVLVEMKNIDPYGRCIYNALLEMCKKSTSPELMDIMAPMPYKTHIKIIKGVKKLFTLPEDEILSYFHEHKDWFYYAVDNGISDDLIRYMAMLVHFDNDEVSDFLDFILMSRNIDSNYKKNLIMPIYKECPQREIMLTIDDYIVRYTLPTLDEVAKLSKMQFTVSCHVIFFFIFTAPYTSMDFSEIISLLKGVKVNKNEMLLLSSYVTFVCSRTLLPGTTLTSVLKHFMLNENEFYAFLQSHGLEI